MGLFRAILCVLLPPLAVVDKGCGPVVLVFFLWLIGIVPGIIGAIIICLLDEGKETIIINQPGKPQADIIDIKAETIRKEEQ